MKAPWLCFDDGMTSIFGTEVVHGAIYRRFGSSAVDVTARAAWVPKPITWHWVKIFAKLSGCSTKGALLKSAYHLLEIEFRRPIKVRIGL